MTNRERVLAAIHHDHPDYTPHNVSFTKQMLAKMIAHTGNPNYIDTVNNHILKLPLRKPLAALPGKTEHFLDEFGIEWDLSGVDKDIGVVARYPLQNAAQLLAFEPPEVDEAFTHRQCATLMEHKARVFTVASVGFALFERAWSLCGMEDLMCYMLTDPDAVHALFARLTAYNLRKLRIALTYDIDAILFGDDWGQQKGLIMGAPLWRKLIRPYMAAMYEEVRASGKVIIQHTCGDNREILDDLIDMGLNVYQTFQPEIYDMREYKRLLSGRLAIWGGISTQTQLPFRTPDEIYAMTKHAMAVLGEGGGYIASPTHDAPGDIPPANIEAMVRAFWDQAL